MVRKQPPGHLLAGAHNVGREYTVLDALKDTDVPVPRTLLFCDDPAVIGTVRVMQLPASASSRPYRVILILLPLCVRSVVLSCRIST